MNLRIVRTVLMVGLRIVPGIFVFAVALAAPFLRHSDGWLRTPAWGVAVGGISLALVCGAWRTRWQRCAGLLALALAGQACVLQLMYSPPWCVYTRYLPWRTMLTSRQGLLLLGLVGQTVVTLWVARRIWPVVKKYIAGLLTVRQVLVLLGVLGFAAALFSENVPQYAVELTLAVWVSVISVLNLCLVAAAVPPDALEKAARWLKRRMHVDSEERKWGLDRCLPWLVALWVIVVSAVVAYFVLERVPHIQDSVSYLFQAKYFSTGRLYLPAPPDADSFAVSHVLNDGTKWFAYGFPGWPAVLALGVLAGVPWLVNPFLGGLAVLLTHTLLRRLYGRATAHAAVLLLAASPWFLIMSASYMTHPVSLVWALLALLALERTRATRSAPWGALTGICLGALFLIRPMEGILVGSVLGLFALGIGTIRVAPRALVAMVVSGMVVGGLVFPYNHMLTGDPLYTAQTKWSDQRWYPGADRIGFGKDIGNVGWPNLDPLAGHGPLDVIINANKNAYMTGFELFGWSFGSLIFAALALWLRGMRSHDWLFLAIILSVIIGHSIYWFSGGPDYGARYWYQVLVPLIVLTVRGIQTLQQRLAGLDFGVRPALRVAAFVVAACVVALINVVPWRCVGKYHRYNNMSADVERLARDHGFGHSLVFIQPKDTEDYALAFIFNPPTLESPETIYAVDAGAAHREVVRQHFPDRPVWFVGRFPTAEDRMRVLAGPFPAGTEGRSER